MGKEKDLESDKKINLALPIIPAFLASSCCLSPSVFAFFGLSFLETVLVSAVWPIRFTALLLLSFFLWLFFRSKEVTSVSDYKNNRHYVISTILQSLLVFVVIYAVMLRLVVPAVCAGLDEQQLCTIGK